MTRGAIWLLTATGVILVGVVAYWQLVIAEGTYLGQRVVTWLYDLTARRYDDIKRYDRRMEDRFLGRPLAAALRYQPAPLVLDVATGTARLPLTLLDQPTFQGRIVGVDASRRMLVVAAQKIGDQAHRIDLVWKDAACLPFPDGSFDAVTCLEMLEFTPNPERQLAEMIRVLRPGGLLLTSRRKGFDARLMPGKTHSREAFIALLERLGMFDITIVHWQADYELVWAIREGRGPGGVRPLPEILRCPKCSAVGFVHHRDHVQCNHCGAAYPICRGVLELER
jgi:ubiquinone/menaquinone biosynthesis C-methylase UbiE